MITEKSKVLWPPTLGLYNPGTRNAYKMRYLAESRTKNNFLINPAEKVTEALAMRWSYNCEVMQAHYLARIQVRPQDGKRMPRAWLAVSLDGERILEDELSAFLPDPEPIDCLGHVLKWKSPDGLFRAVAMVDDEPDSTQRLGFNMTHASLVEIHLSRIEAEEKVFLEMELVSALYTARMKDENS